MGTAGQQMRADFSNLAHRCASEAKQARVLRILRQASLTMEARLEKRTLTVENLLGLREGHVLVFDLPLTKPVELMVNGARKFTAQVVSMGKKRACRDKKRAGRHRVRAARA